MYLFVCSVEQCKGFAHVEFDSSANALAAIDQLAGKEIEGRPLKVNSAGRKPDEGDRPRKTFQERGAASSSTAISGDAVVFVGNLAWDVTDELMEEMLSDVVGKDSFVKVCPCGFESSLFTTDHVMYHYRCALQRIGKRANLEALLT